MKLVNNPESWLAFTDLIFVDPVGTGFSRAVEKEKQGTAEKESDKKKNRRPPSFTDSRGTWSPWASSCRSVFHAIRDGSLRCLSRGRATAVSGRPGLPGSPSRTMVAADSLQDERERERAYAKMSRMLGLPRDLIRRHHGRISPSTFEGPGPTLFGIDRVFYRRHQRPYPG